MVFGAESNRNRIAVYGCTVVSRSTNVLNNLCFNNYWVFLRLQK